MKSMETMGTTQSTGVRGMTQFGAESVMTLCSAAMGMTELYPVMAMTILMLGLAMIKSMVIQPTRQVHIPFTTQVDH